MADGAEQSSARRLMVPGIFAGILFASLLLLGTTSWLVWHSGQRALASATSSAQNLVTVFDRHLLRMIDPVRIILRTAQNQFGGSVDDAKARSLFDFWLDATMSELPHLHAVSIVDAGNGALLYGFSRSGETATNGPRHDAAPLAGQPFAVGAAVFDTVSQSWGLPLSREIAVAGGARLLRVTVTLSLTHLQEAYDALDIGPGGSLALLRSDGLVLARRPYARDFIGQSVQQPPEIRARLADADSGSFTSDKTIDGVARIISFQRVGDAPLIAVVALSVADVLARWRQDLTHDFVLAGLCACLLALLGLILIRIVRLRDRSDLHLRTTLDHMAQGLLMVGLSGRIEVYNKRVLAMLDLPESLLAQRPTPATVLAFQEDQGEFFRTDRAVRDRIEQDATTPSAGSYERLRPNGSVLEVRTTLLPDGGIVRTYSDVTQRQKAIDDMNASMAFANSLVNSSPDAITLLDLEGKITFISELGQELFEVSDVDAVRGRPFTLFFPPEHHERVELALRRVRSGHTDRFTRMCPTLAGMPKWWDFIITPVHEIGRPLDRLFVVARDISARQAHALELSRAKEAAERASQAKTQFLASMSHEIRTPLNAILGFAALAREGNDRDPELRRRIELIEKAGESLLTIINDVLDLSKIEAGRVELEERPLDLRGLVDDCLSLMKGLAAQKKLELRGEIAPAVPARIVADEARLRQVLLNLLNNAVKFTAAGSVSVSVAVSQDGATLEAAIRDTGIGIPQDRVAHLFQDFVQVDGSISRKYGGTGLGLSISRRLILLMGGEIGVDSVEGEGSTFRFSLPLREAATEATIDPPQPETARPEASRSILLVDDLPINLEIVSGMLTSAGHRVTVATSGPEAITAYRALRPDLILMDVQMPDMDGLDTTRHLRMIDEPARNVPIIALTANVFAQQIESYRRAGMNDHLGKPFHRDALLEMVAHWTDATRPAAGVTAVPPQPALLDDATLQELSGLIGADKVRDLLRRFQSELPERLVATGSAEIGMEAHAIVSTAGLLGFQALAAAARLVEQTAEAGDDLAQPLLLLLEARRAALAQLATMVAEPESTASDRRAAETAEA
ncbi:MAG: ATP-binding protein [Bosea sp. (in: a-proteobacteria)]